MSGRDYQLWQPLLAIADWIDRKGTLGTLGYMQEYALLSLETSGEERVSPCDEIILKVITRCVQSGRQPTASEVLGLAREVAR